MEYHTILRNGKIIDGTGNPWFKGDVGIINDKIEKIGYLNNCSALIDIDVKGNVVSPGFIDLHTHADLQLLIDPKSISQITQGVTTIVIGNCGFSVAPVIDSELIKRYILSIIEQKTYLF